MQPELLVQSGVYIGTDENFAALLDDSEYILVDIGSNMRVLTWHVFHRHTHGRQAQVQPL